LLLGFTISHSERGNVSGVKTLQPLPQPAAVENEVRRHVEHRHENKSPLGDAGMRQRQFGRVGDEITVDQHIAVERARPPALLAHAVQRPLCRKAALEQVVRRHVRCYRDARVDEPILIGLAPRCGPVVPGTSNNTNIAVGREVLDGARNVATLVAKVRAQSEDGIKVVHGVFLRG